MYLDDAIVEVCDFLKVPPDVAAARMRGDYRKYTHDDWRARVPNPKDAQAVARFYAETDSYVYELMAHNCTAVQHRWNDAILGLLRTYEISSFADIGAGIGQLQLLAYFAGIASRHIDVPGVTFDFARWRYARYKARVDMLTIEQFAASVDLYECITSFEVLEHLHDPATALKSWLAKLMPGGGVFIFSHGLDGKDEPLHTVSPRSSEVNIPKILKKEGLTLCGVHDEFPAIEVWRRL